MAIFSVVAVSCTDRNDDVVVQDNPYTPLMLDVNANLTLANDFTVLQGVTLNSTDVVLVYRNINSNSTSAAAWQLLPKTEFLSNGRELDYNFLFNTQNVEIYTEANFDQTLLTANEAAQYLMNQRFRIVIVPAKQGKNANLKYEDYQSVIKFYNIPDRD